MKVTIKKPKELKEERIYPYFATCKASGKENDVFLIFRVDGEPNILIFNVSQNNAWFTNSDIEVEVNPLPKGAKITIEN